MPDDAAACATASVCSSVISSADGDLVRAELTDREQFFDHDALSDNRFELVVDQVDRVDLLARVAINDGASDVADFVDIEVEKERRVVASDFDGLRTVTHDLIVRCQLVVIVLCLLLIDGHGKPLADVRDGLSADRLHVDVLSLRSSFSDEGLAGPDDVRVEGACKALVASDEDDKDVLLLALLQQRMHDVAGVFVVEVGAANEGLKHVRDHARVGPGQHRTLLRTAQLRRRNHLHGLGDLPRVLDTADASP